MEQFNQFNQKAMEQAIREFEEKVSKLGGDRNKLSSIDKARLENLKRQAEKQGRKIQEVSLEVSNDTVEPFFTSEKVASVILHCFAKGETGTNVGKFVTLVQAFLAFDNMIDIIQDQAITTFLEVVSERDILKTCVDALVEMEEEVNQDHIFGLLSRFILEETIMPFVKMSKEADKRVNKFYNEVKDKDLSDEEIMYHLKRMAKEIDRDFQ